MNQFVKLIKARGWKAIDVAKRWGFSQPYMSLLGRNPKQVHLDAVAGLPNKKCKDCKCKVKP